MTYETTLHLLYVACMAAGALLFAAWARHPRGVHREEYLVAILIPVWSGIAYLAMAFNLGTVDVAGQMTYWARYADWVVTTPLLLVALAFTAMHRLPKRDYTLIGALVAADVVMILCGLVGDLSPYPTRYVFFWIGVVALAVVFWLAWGPLRRLAWSQGDDLGRVYTIVAGYLTVLWVGYPTTWILGPSGLGQFGQSVDTLLFVVLPVFSKVGFSILDLTLLRRLSPSRAANPALAV
jgi:bacteriorhodopsin